MKQANQKVQRVVIAFGHVASAFIEELVKDGVLGMSTFENPEGKDNIFLFSTAERLGSMMLLENALREKHVPNNEYLMIYDRGLAENHVIQLARRMLNDLTDHKYSYMQVETISTEQAFTTGRGLVINSDSLLLEIKEMAARVEKHNRPIEVAVVEPAKERALVHFYISGLSGASIGNLVERFLSHLTTHQASIHLLPGSPGKDEDMLVESLDNIAPGVRHVLIVEESKHPAVLETVIMARDIFATRGIDLPTIVAGDMAMLPVSIASVLRNPPADLPIPSSAVVEDDIGEVVDSSKREQPRTFLFIQDTENAAAIRATITQLLTSLGPVADFVESPQIGGASNEEFAAAYLSEEGIEFHKENKFVFIADLTLGNPLTQLVPVVNMFQEYDIELKVVHYPGLSATQGIFFTHLLEALGVVRPMEKQESNDVKSIAEIKEEANAMREELRTDGEANDTTFSFPEPSAVEAPKPRKNFIVIGHRSRGLIHELERREEHTREEMRSFTKEDHLAYFDTPHLINSQPFIDYLKGHHVEGNQYLVMGDQNILQLPNVVELKKILGEAVGVVMEFNTPENDMGGVMGALGNHQTIGLLTNIIGQMNYNLKTHGQPPIAEEPIAPNPVQKPPFNESQQNKPEEDEVMKSKAVYLFTPQHIGVALINSMGPIINHMESIGGAMLSLDLMWEKPALFDTFIDEVENHHPDTQYGVIVPSEQYDISNETMAALGTFTNNLRAQGKEPKILVVNDHSHFVDVYSFLKEAMSPPVVAQFEAPIQPAFEPVFVEQLMRRVQAVSQNADLTRDMLSELFEQVGNGMKVGVPHPRQMPNGRVQGRLMPQQEQPIWAPVPPVQNHGFGPRGGFFGTQGQPNFMPSSMYDRLYGTGARLPRQQAFRGNNEVGSRLPRGFGFAPGQGRKLTSAPAPVEFKQETEAWDRKDEVLSSQRNHAVPSSRVHLIPTSPEANHELNTWSVTKRRTQAGIQQLSRVTIHAVGMEGLNQIPSVGNDTRVVLVKASNAFEIDTQVANHFAEKLAERDINAAVATMEQVDVMFEAEETGKSTKRDMVLVISTDAQVLARVGLWASGNNGKLVTKVADVITASLPSTSDMDFFGPLEAQLSFANWIVFTGNIPKDLAWLHAVRSALLKRGFENVTVEENPETVIENKYLFSN